MKIKKRKKKNPSADITEAEFMMIGSVALLADLLGPFGFPFVLILAFWSIVKFKKFPAKKFITTCSVEVLSLGLLPGWTCYIIALFLEQKGYMPKALSKLAK